MEQYKFEPKVSETIVNAIVDGYRDYVEHRKDRYEKMTISSAFAWTKGNFIESKIAEMSPTLNLTYKTAKAGLTWDYLQFIHGDTKKLFLIKNAAYFNEDCFSQALLPNKKKSKGRDRTYLHELSKINQDLEFTCDNPLQFSNSGRQGEQLSLFVPEKQIKDELEQFQDTYSEFHILTYKIDDARQISEIMHFLPNPENNIAYRIEDLSEYISGSELTDEEREIIAPEQDSGIIDPAAFDIGILEDEDEESN
ncbi:spr1630 family ClpXP-sensitive toxin [Gracilibacillus massiliensis]|uniref:spr1630 family ClpXP-sensitive toxin n=1 Tax=Gracilibacillus massiliensis TaxID=1564956 RepID=UPI00071CA973|nr:DUF5986 family protein [Gracilibacillus massiliensis]